MGITDAALNNRIQTVKGPDLDAEIKNLFSVLAAGQRAANRGGGGGRGGGSGGMGKLNWIFDEETGKFVPVPGGSEKIATNNFAAMKRWQAKQAINSDAGEGVRKKLAEFDNASVEKQAEMLSQMRKEDIPALAKATNVNPALLIEQALGEATAAHRKRKAEIDKQSTFGTGTDSGKIGFNRFLDNIADIFSNGEEQIARAKRREEYEKEIRDQNPVLDNLERRRREGADAFDLLGSKGGIVSTIGETVGEMGGPLAFIGGVGGGVAKGAQLAGKGINAVNRARMAGTAAAGAFTGAGQQITAGVDRLNADQTLTDEQKAQLADDMKASSMALGGAIGAVVFPFAEPAMRGIGRGVANRGIGNSLTAQAVRRANERGLSREVAEPFISAARAADDEAAIKALNQGGLGGFMSGWARGIPLAAVENTALSVPQQMAANAQYGRATGKPVDITEGVGDAVLGSILSAPLLGAFSRPVGPKPPAVSARDQLLNATGVRANVGIGLPEGGANNGAIVPRAYDPNQVINPGGLGAGTATGEVIDTTFRNAPEALPGQTPALTTGESARATEHGPIEQPTGTTTALPAGRPGRTTSTYEHGPIPRPAGTNPRAIPSTTSDEARAAGDVLYGHGWEARPITLSGKFSNWQSVGATEDLKNKATKFVTFPGKKTVAKGIEDFNAWKQTTTPEDVAAMRRLLASQRQADNYEKTYSQKQREFIDQVLKQEESANSAPTAPKTGTEQTTTTTEQRPEPAPTTRPEPKQTTTATEQAPEPSPATRPEQAPATRPEPEQTTTTTEQAPEPAPTGTQKNQQGSQQNNPRVEPVDIAGGKESPDITPEEREISARKTLDNFILVANKDVAQAMASLEHWSKTRQFDETRRDLTRQLLALRGTSRFSNLSKNVQDAINRALHAAGGWKSCEPQMEFFLLTARQGYAEKAARDFDMWVGNLEKSGEAGKKFVFNAIERFKERQASPEFSKLSPGEQKTINRILDKYKDYGQQKPAPKQENTTEPAPAPTAPKQGSEQEPTKTISDDTQGAETGQKTGDTEGTTKPYFRRGTSTTQEMYDSWRADPRITKDAADTLESLYRIFHNRQETEETLTDFTKWVTKTARAGNTTQLRNLLTLIETLSDAERNSAGTSLVDFLDRAEKVLTKALQPQKPWTTVDVAREQISLLKQTGLDSSNLEAAVAKYNNSAKTEADRRALEDALPASSTVTREDLEKVAQVAKQHLANLIHSGMDETQAKANVSMLVRQALNTEKAFGIPASETLNQVQIIGERLNPPKGKTTLNQSAVQNDTKYMDAVNRNDTETVQRMVEDAARAAGFNNAIPETTDAYRIRTKPAPKKTIKVYKIFTINDKGEPTALFVSGKVSLPVGVWLDAQEPYKFQGTNGKWYIPATSNPYAVGKKTTGDSRRIPNEEVKAELLRRGFIKTPKANTVTALSYRPGWHAGSLPFFPQGGTKVAGSNYGNVHKPNQVIYECEMAADTDYTAFARSQAKARNKDGSINLNNADLQEMPVDGFYRYKTNRMLKAADDEEWVLSGSLKILRPLTQAECDTILASHGKKPQEWAQGKLDLSELNVNPERNDAARKTLAPITYDENGNVIPLSKRFNPDNPDVLYQKKGKKKASSGNPNDVRGMILIGENGAKDTIALFDHSDPSTLPHETAHAYTAQMDRTIKDNGHAAMQAMKEQLPAGIDASDGVSLADIRKQVEAMPEGAEKAKALKAVEQCEYRMQRLEQLKADRRTLRRFANMPEEGKLSNEQYVHYQEQVARAFEQYVATGKAPTPELTGVFQRFFQWLKGLYQSWREYVGKDVPEEVYGVFDRWFDANSKRGLGGEGNANTVETSGLSGVGRSDAGGTTEAPVRNSGSDSGRPEGASTDSPVGGTEAPVQTADGRENTEAGGNAGTGAHPATETDAAAATPAEGGTGAENPNGGPGAGRPAGGREGSGPGAGSDESAPGVRAGSDRDTGPTGEQNVAPTGTARPGKDTNQQQDTNQQTETPAESAPTVEGSGSTPMVTQWANSIREESNRLAPQLEAEAAQLRAEADQASAARDAFCKEHNIQRGSYGSYEVPQDMPADVRAQFQEIDRAANNAGSKAYHAAERVKANAEAAKLVEDASNALLSGKNILADNLMRGAAIRMNDNNLPEGETFSNIYKAIWAAKDAEAKEQQAQRRDDDQYGYDNKEKEVAALLKEADDLRAPYGLPRSQRGEQLAKKLEERRAAEKEFRDRIRAQNEEASRKDGTAAIADEAEELAARHILDGNATWAAYLLDGADFYHRQNNLNRGVVGKTVAEAVAAVEKITKNPPEYGAPVSSINASKEQEAAHYEGWAYYYMAQEDLFRAREEMAKADKLRMETGTNRSADGQAVADAFDAIERVRSVVDVATKSRGKEATAHNLTADLEKRAVALINEPKVSLFDLKRAESWLNYAYVLKDRYGIAKTDEGAAAAQALERKRAQLVLTETGRSKKDAVGPKATGELPVTRGTLKNITAQIQKYFGSDAYVIDPTTLAIRNELTGTVLTDFRVRMRTEGRKKEFVFETTSPAWQGKDSTPLLSANIKKYFMGGEPMPTEVAPGTPPYTPEIHKQLQDFKAANPRAGIKKLTDFYRSLLDPKAPEEAGGITLNQTANPDLGAQLITADTEAGFGTTEAMASDRSPVMESLRQEDAQARQDAETAKTVSELSDLLDGGMYLGQSATKGVKAGCQKTANAVLRDIQRTGMEGMKQRMEDVKRIQDYVSGTQMGTSNWFINLKNWFFQNFTSDRGLMHLWLHTFARDGRAMDNRVIQAFEGMQAVVQAKNVEYQDRMKTFLRQLEPTAVSTGMSVNDVAELVGHYHVAHDVANTNALLIERWQASADAELAQARAVSAAGLDPKEHLDAAEKHLRNIEKLRIQNGEIPDNGRYDWSKEQILSCGYTNPEAEALMERVSKKLGLTRDQLNGYAAQLTAEFNFLLKDRAAAGVIHPNVLNSFPDRPTYAPMVSRRGVGDAPGNLTGCMSDANPYNPGKYYAIDGRYTRPDSSFISYQSYAKRAAIEIGSRDFGVALNAVYERLAREGGGALEASGLRRMNYDQMLAMRNNGMADAMDALYSRGGMVVSLPDAKGDMHRWFFNFKAGGWDAQGARFFGDTLSKSISSAFKMVDVMAPIDLAARGSTAMGMLSTRFTPLFAPVAALRDFAERTLNIVNRTYYREDGTAISGTTAATQFALNSATASNIVRQATLTRNLDPNSEAGRLWSEFTALGGVQRFTDRGYQRDINNLVKTPRSVEDLLNGPNGQNVVMDKLGLTSKPARQVFALGSASSKRALATLDRWNDTWQNSAAFTHFYTLRKMGVSAVDAAAGAREMMNLSQRGKLGPFFQMLAPFVVPTVQAGTAMLRTLGFGANRLRDVPKEGLKGYLALLGAFGAYCLLQPLARDAMGTDENGNSRYDALPASELSRYLPISLGGDDYFKFPVGFGLPQIGALMAVGFDRVSQGTMKPQDLAFDVAFAAIHNMSPGGWPAFGFSEDPAAYITNMIVPQFAKPFAEVAMNTNSFGSSIYNPTTGPEQAKSDAGKLTTPHRYHDLARAANEFFGIDTYPEAYRHLEQNLLRGPARFFSLWAQETDDIYKGADKPTALNSVPPSIAALGITSLYGRVTDATRNQFYTAKKAYDERLRGENISFSGKPGNVDSAEYRQAILEEAGWEPEAIEDYITLYKASVSLRNQGRAFNNEYREKWRGMTDPDELKEGFNRLADDNDVVYAGAVQKLHYWGS